MDKNILISTIKNWSKYFNEDDIQSAITEVYKQKNSKQESINKLRKELLDIWNKNRSNGDPVTVDDVTAIIVYYYADALDSLDREYVSDLMTEISEDLVDRKTRMQKIVDPSDSKIIRDFLKLFE